MSSNSLRYTKSWVAYIMPGIGFLLLVLIGAPVLLSGFASLQSIITGEHTFYVLSLFGAGALLWIILLAYSIVRILTVRSFVLYSDDAGVWIFSGVLPWSKGCSGVRWSEIDGAIYYPGFLSWLFGSYTVKVSHKYTKSNELNLTHVKCGNEAVGKINEILENGVFGAAPGL